MEQPEKMDLKSMNIPEDKKEQLRQLFPEVFTEKKIDLEKLKLALGEMIEVGKERYGLNWAGKSDCFKIIQQPSVGTLKPCREESVNFDDTENLFIEGDNLEVLKLLQKAYYGKVKMIYIDPPYNTGNDFIYPDNYSESLDTYLKYTGQVDAEGRKYSTNTEADGRFHTKWINMMYPRLYLARNLLRDDGVIFISIDDNEVDNLKMLCNEIFGENNFIAQVVIINNLKGRNDKKNIALCHEYLLMYQRNDFTSYGIPLTEEQKKRFKHIDKDNRRYELRDLRRRGTQDKREDRPKMFFPIYCNPKNLTLSLERLSDNDVEILPKRGDNTDGRWRWGIDRVAEKLHILHPRYSKTKTRWDIDYRVYMDVSPEEVDSQDNGDDEQEIEEITSKAKSAWMGGELSSDVGKRSFKELFQDVDYDYPKTLAMMKRMINMAMRNDDIVLDFFAGSATIAQAVIESNKDDGGKLRFICIQLPENIDDSLNVQKAGFKTISDIGKERIRRVITKIVKERETKLDLESEKLDLGFRVLRLTKSNFKIWETENAEESKKLEEQLQLHVDHIDPKSTQEDILYELLLKSGFDLATKTEKLKLAGKTVYSIADGAMLICLEENLTKEVINAIAEMTPSRVICLDKGFKDNDQLKTNAVQIMKSKKVNTFLTV